MTLKGRMSFQKAVEVLAGAVKDELTHSTGDISVRWTRDGRTVARAHFSRGDKFVIVFATEGFETTIFRDKFFEAPTFRYRKEASWLRGTSAHKGKMPVEKAAEFLRIAKRDVLDDHAFGDAEVGWIRDGKEVATGYFGYQDARVTVLAADGFETTTFRDKDAEALRRLGHCVQYTRNDSGE
jgi:hypothetical protein